MNRTMANRNHFFAIIGAVLLAILAATMRHVVRPTPTERAASSDLHMTVMPPSTTKTLASASYEVILDRHERPVSDAAVSIFLGMSNMMMPPNHFSLSPVFGHPGHFRGTGVLTMKGPWEVTAIAHVGHEKTRAQLQIEAN